MYKVLIANRGEIACRIIRSCKLLGYSTVAVYSEADKSAQHVQLADEAYHIGPAPVHESYLNREIIINTALRSKAHLVHPGYGLLSENPNFAAAVKGAGLIWVGPSAQTILAMGDKGQARNLAVASKVPIVPGSAPIPLDDPCLLGKIANDLGFPLMVKATGGGGGIGMRLVKEPSKLSATVTSVSALAERTFGDNGIFLERHISNARHVEVQIFGLGDGRVFHLSDRECSIQRRFQKVIEEAPAPNISEELRKKISDAACRIASDQFYSGAGTVEFIFDNENNNFYFLEMNTRIQVEHPVTELISGEDIVQLQLMLAVGHDLGHMVIQPPKFHGHAIECRVYAEKPEKNFIPTPGLLKKFSLPTASSTIRIDTGFSEGDIVTPFYDPMVAKIIAYDTTRKGAVAAMKNALDNTLVEGISTNIRFLKNVINHPNFQNGDINTNFIETHKVNLIP
ncbi:MAG: acetyl-CoA carboxylase biotin carboxylase subunit [Rhodospirillaceae bacterium]|nr:acetyl-CoA carboxylase biotin carboxylase subunit [Rhodospirillaceae bacterium]|tara:strand:+ start:4259 stop:5620 length:1362 start_codon:yes stop_codon:yes gene_type:complete